MSEEITQEQIVEFYDFLQGKVPEGMTVKKPPKLSQEQAFTVIWFLQEHLCVLPDNFEQCSTCHVIYNSDFEGFYLDCGYDDRELTNGKPIPKKYVGAYCSDICCPIEWQPKAQ